MSTASEDDYRLSLAKTAFDAAQLGLARGNLPSVRTSMDYISGTLKDLPAGGPHFNIASGYLSSLVGELKAAEGNPDGVRANQQAAVSSDKALTDSVAQGNLTAKARQEAEARYIANAETYGAYGAEALDVGEKVTEAAKGALDAIALPSLGIGLLAVALVVAYVVFSARKVV